MPKGRTSKRRRGAIVALALAAFFAVTSVVPPHALAGAGSLTAERGMEIYVNFQYPPTDDDIARMREAIQEASEILCDATDGQVKISRATVTGGAGGEAQADIWVLSQPGRSGVTFFGDGSGLGRLDEHINLLQGGIDGAVIAHELGHLAFGLADQYDEQRRWGSGCGLGRGFEPAAVDDRNNTLMQNHTTMTELSVRANHDLVRGDGLLCPAPEPTSELRLGGTLDTRRPRVLSPDNPAPAFDATSFDTATATSARRIDREIFDSLGDVPNFFEGSAHRLSAFFEHLDAQHWIAHFAVDGRRFGNPLETGPEAVYRHVGSVPLRFDPETGEPLALEATERFLRLSDPDTGAPDIVIEIDVDALREPPEGAGLAVTVAANGRPACRAWERCETEACNEWDRCELAWNTTTVRGSGLTQTTGHWEATQQTLFHGASDWEVLTRNYPFISAPAGLPLAEPDAHCADPVEIVERITGADQIMLIVDRSGSMNTAVRPDADVTRMDFAKAAARMFVDLQENRATQVGVISFSSDVGVERFFEDVTSSNAAAFRESIDALEADGLTAIGDALVLSISEFQRVEEEGRNRVAFLLSDGYNNRGTDPLAAAEQLRRRGIQVFTITVGEGSDRVVLQRLAGETGGAMLDAETGEELPSVYLELAARAQGQALALPRTASLVQPLPVIVIARDPSSNASIVPTSEEFEIPVEAGAEELQLLVSARHHPSTLVWRPEIEIESPSGVPFRRGSAGVREDPDYALFMHRNPEPGIWRLRLRARLETGTQSSYVAGAVIHPKADCFASAWPPLAIRGGSIRLGGGAAYGIDLENVSLDATVHRPDGTSVVIPLRRTMGGTYEGLFNQFSGSGAYTAEVRCRVSSSSRALRGEVIFEGEQFETSVTPFEKVASASFLYYDVDDAASIPAPLPSSEEETCAEDRDPPQIRSLEVAPNCLWPPNGKWVRFGIDQFVADVHDVCDPDPTVRIVDVRIEEAAKHPPVRDSEVIFGSDGACLRAARHGTSKAGRRYVVVVAATDADGNVATREVEVRVPHDQGSPNRCESILAPGDFIHPKHVKEACQFEGSSGEPVLMCSADPSSRARGATLLWYIFPVLMLIVRRRRRLEGPR